jgi:hypothetical protein
MHRDTLLELFRYLPGVSAESTLDALIAASQVCRDWRSVALTNVELWATIPMKNGHRWAEEALERSRPKSIVLHIPLSRHSPRPTEKTVLRVFQDLPRARKFSLVFDGWPTPNRLGEGIINALRASAVPRLEDLSLVFRNACPDVSGLFAAQPPENLRALSIHNAWFSGPLFAADKFTGERLRYIRLTGEGSRTVQNTAVFPFPLPDIPLHALTRLEAPRAQWRSLDSLLQCLARMPALEELQLANFVDPLAFEEDWSAGLASSVLALPGLRRLGLEGRGDYVAELFVCLRMPISTKLQFVCHLPSPRLATFLRAMQRAVLAHYAGAPACFKQASIGENVRCFYFSATDYDDAYKLYVELIDIGPQTSSLVEEHLGFLRSLLASRPFSGLQTLYFNDVRVLEINPPWREWRGSLDSVTLVHLQARATHGLVDALSDTQLFPILRTLSIKGDVEDSVLEPLVQSARQPRVEIRRR